MTKSPLAESRLSLRSLTPLRLHQIILAAVIAIVVFSLLNWRNAWVLATEVDQYIKYALANGTGLKWEDIAKAFDARGTDHYAARCFRPLDGFFLILDAKFRATLWRHIIPHPALSITWIFSLLLSPVLLYKLLRNLNSDAETAIGLVTFYLASPGLLSTVVMHFRPAKPMMNFGLIFCLYLASRLARKGEGKFHGFLLLTGSVFFFFFFDETALLIFPAVPFFFPKLFAEPRRIAVYLALVPLTAFTYFWGIPWVTEALGKPKPQPLEYNHLRDFFRSPVFTAEFFRHLAVNVRLLFQESLGLANPFAVKDLAGRILITANFFVVAFAVYIAGKRFCVKFRDRPAGLAHSGILLLGLLFLGVFHTKLMDTKEKIGGLYWYGAYFSVFLVLIIAAWNSELRKKSDRSWYPLRAGLMTIPLFSMLYLFYYTNLAYKCFHHYPNRPKDLAKVFKGEINRFDVESYYDRSAHPTGDLFERTRIFWNFTQSRPSSQGRPRPDFDELARGELSYLIMECRPRD